MSETSNPAVTSADQVLPQDGRKPTDVSRRIVAASRLLSQSARQAASGPCMLLAMLGMLATTIVWTSLAWCLIPTVNTSAAQLDAQRLQNFHDQIGVWPGSVRLTDGLGKRAVTTMGWGRPVEAGVRAPVPVDPVVGVAWRLMEPFRRCLQTGLSWRETVYYLLGAVCSLGIWAYFGGAIARWTLLRLQHQSTTLHDCAEFARQHWLDYCSGPALPLIGICLLASPFVLVGWLMRLEIGLLLAALLWAPILAIGILMAVLALGLACCWPLMWGAVAADKSDGFDAISRGYAYVFQRPLVFACYALMASAVGLVGWVAVWWLSEIGIEMGYWSLSWGAGNGRLAEVKNMISAPTGSTETSVQMTAVLIFSSLVALVRGLASAYSFSYFWAASVSLYLLMRQAVDHADTDQRAG